jgi:hypothetical protein
MYTLEEMWIEYHFIRSKLLCLFKISFHIVYLLLLILTSIFFYIIPLKSDEEDWHLGYPCSDYTEFSCKENIAITIFVKRLTLCLGLDIKPQCQQFIFVWNKWIVKTYNHTIVSIFFNSVIVLNNDYELKIQCIEIFLTMYIFSVSLID